MQLITYLGFGGNCEEAFRYYEKHLGGKIEALFRYSEAPNVAEIPADKHKQIMHVRLAIGDAVLMGGDNPHGNFAKPHGFSVNVQVDDVKEGERMFNALADGGTVMMPYAQTFWAERFGMCIDRFGTPWMVNAGAESA